MIVQDIKSHCLLRIYSTESDSCMHINYVGDGKVGKFRSYWGGAYSTCAYSTYTGSVCCFPNACMLYPAVAILCV